MMEEVTPMPPMIYWTLTEMNIKVIRLFLCCFFILTLTLLYKNFQAEDELTLSHIPYMGESDKTFCEELMEAYPDGIHGTKVGCGEYINDYILFNTVKYCAEDAKQIRELLITYFSLL
jgi:hypothetical protein